MKLKTMISFAFTFIFLFQNVALATGVSSSDASRLHLSRFVENFNSLTNYQRLKYIEWTNLDRPKSDQIFLKSIENLDKIEWPDLSLNGEKISFTWNSQSVEFSVTGDNEVTLKGEAIDFAPGKLAEAALKIDSLLSHPNTSLVDFFISSAHAAAVEKIIYVAAAATAIMALVVLWAGSLAATPIALGFVVGAFVLGFEAEKAKYTSKDIEKLCDKAKDFGEPQKVRAILDGLKARTGACSLRPVLCSKVKSCLEKIASGEGKTKAEAKSDSRISKERPSSGSGSASKPKASRH